ncbi:hypothetical protein [Corynebacterium cystitidis]|uniref:hypothetical protein n=1 Tax=Corynebacterium cystitidis TaxID=35757 RepID=UPI00211DBDAE|nr:hypothetical protein [Corynebacterium cystitidis]
MKKRFARLSITAMASAIAVFSMGTYVVSAAPVFETNNLSSLSSNLLGGSSVSPASGEVANKAVDVADLNKELNKTDANFRFESIEGRSGEFEIVITFDSVTFRTDPDTGNVIAVNPDGTEDVFSENSIKVPVGPDFSTTTRMISENTVSITAHQTGYVPYANPYNLFGCVQNVLGSAALLASILGTTAVVAQALAAAGAAVAIAAATLYCSTI